VWGKRMVGSKVQHLRKGAGEEQRTSWPPGGEDAPKGEKDKEKIGRCGEWTYRTPGNVNNPGKNWEDGIQKIRGENFSLDAADGATYRATRTPEKARVATSER